MTTLPTRGDYDRTVNSDGSWTITDRSDGGALLSRTPRSRVTPPLVDTDFYVANITERAAGSGTERKYIDLDLDRATERDTVGSPLTQSADSDEWSLDFDNGTIATSFLSATEAAGNDTWQLTGNLSGAQAEVVAQSAATVEAVSVESVADGDNFARDNSPGTRNTLTITRPSSLASSYGPDGTYVVQSWSIQTAGGDRYGLTMSVRTDGS